MVTYQVDILDPKADQRTKKGLSKNEEIRNLTERIEQLEPIKELQQDIIVDFEKITGEELAKKYLP